MKIAQYTSYIPNTDTNKKCKMLKHISIEKKFCLTICIRRCVQYY